MGNAEELYAYIEKLAQFLRDTNSISEMLMHLHLEAIQTGESPSKELVLITYERFKELTKQAETDGISDDSIFRNQVQTINSAFAFFKDIVPDLKELP